MAVWLVRAGRQGENEQAALDQGIAAIGWMDLADTEPAQNREAVAELYRQTYPDASTAKTRKIVQKLFCKFL
jgi:restriction system protein